MATTPRARAQRATSPTTAAAGEDEQAQARAVFVEIHRQALWNPWVLEERADELAAAEAVFKNAQLSPARQRAAKRHADEVLAQMEAQAARDAADRAREQQARAARYDDQRHRARLTLLEAEATAEHYRQERDGLVAKAHTMDEDRRQRALVTAERELAAAQRAVGELQAQVGDPETVADQQGWLPAERRELMLERFGQWRQEQVYTLRRLVAAIPELLKTKPSRAETRELRDKLATAQWRLDTLLAVPQLESDEMCSECARPVSWHGWQFDARMGALGAGPCAAWPSWVVTVERVRQILATAVDTPTEPPPAPPPKPLAIIPSGLPLAEVTARLSQLQAEHPDATVRRGKGNSWEVWPE